MGPDYDVPKKEEEKEEKRQRAVRRGGGREGGREGRPEKVVLSCTSFSNQFLFQGFRPRLYFGMGILSCPFYYSSPLLVALQMDLQKVSSALFRARPFN